MAGGAWPGAPGPHCIGSCVGRIARAPGPARHGAGFGAVARGQYIRARLPPGLGGALR